MPHKQRYNMAQSDLWFLQNARGSFFLRTVVKKEINLCWESLIKFTPLWIWVTMKTQQKHSHDLLKNSTLPWKCFQHTNNSPYGIWWHTLVTLRQLPSTAILSDEKKEFLYPLFTEGLAKLRSNLMALCSNDQVHMEHFDKQHSLWVRNLRGLSTTK